MSFTFFTPKRTKDSLSNCATYTINTYKNTEKLRIGLAADFCAANGLRSGDRVIFGTDIIDNMRTIAIARAKNGCKLGKTPAAQSLSFTLKLPKDFPFEKKSSTTIVKVVYYNEK